MSNGTFPAYSHHRCLVRCGRLCWSEKVFERERGGDAGAAILAGYGDFGADELIPTGAVEGVCLRFTKLPSDNGFNTAADLTE